MSNPTLPASTPPHSASTTVAGLNSTNEPSLLPGLNTLILGPTGVGKTHSIGTACDYGKSRGLEVFVQFLESGKESLVGYWTDRGLTVPDNVHWNELERTGFSFANMAETAKTINQYTMDMIFKMTDQNRGKHNEFERLCRQFCDFEDQRTGIKFGAIDSWGPNRMLVIDGLTGLCAAAMALVVGGKPLRDQRDWGVAQDQTERMVRQLCDGVKAHFCLLGHVERETDPVFGGVKIMPSALGKALPPKLAPMFSDVILAQREGSNWHWSTANPQADLKTRNLPIAEKIKPDFAQIFQKWESRGGKFTPTVKKS